MTEPEQPVALTVLPVTGIGEVAEGDDLAGLLGTRADLRDGDVLLVTSKVVSKAEGRVATVDKAAAAAAETDRVVATRGATAIVRTRRGLVMANAGVDASNTRAGTVVLLPEDPDASARRLRERLAAHTGPNVAVVVTDTFGRAWRTGQTDVAVGAAGLEVLRDYAGRVDAHGNELAVTAPAVADELAAAADLVKGKLSGVPAAVVRGLPAVVLPRGSHGPGAAALVRDEAEDLFGYGAREAVVRALVADPAQARGFGGACAAADLVTVLQTVAGTAAAIEIVGEGVEAHPDAPSERDRGRVEARLLAAAFAAGWRQVERQGEAGGTDIPGILRFRPGTP